MTDEIKFLKAIIDNHDFSDIDPYLKWTSDLETMVGLYTGEANILKKQI